MSLFKKLKKDIEAKSDDEQEQAIKEEEEEKEEEESRDEQEQEEKRSQSKDNWVEPEGQLAVDVFQEEGKFIVEAPIAGVKPEDLEVLVEEGTLIIRGSRQKPTTKETRKYFYQECYWGGFSREIVLPDDVDASKIKARFKNGILTIEIPKTSTKQRKRIAISVDD